MDSEDIPYSGRLTLLQYCFQMGKRAPGAWPCRHDGPARRSLPCLCSLLPARFLLTRGAPGGCHSGVCGGALGHPDLQPPPTHRQSPQRQSAKGVGQDSFRASSVAGACSLKGMVLGRRSAQAGEVLLLHLIHRISQVGAFQRSTSHGGVRPHLPGNSLSSHGLNRKVSPLPGP